MKKIILIATAFILTTGVSLASETEPKEYTIRCVPVFEVTVLNNDIKRHSLVLKDGKRECSVWLGDGEEPELANFNLKPNVIYTFVLESHPDWAGAAIAQAGVTSPPGFLKRIMIGQRIIWEDEKFKELGVWK